MPGSARHVRNFSLPGGQRHSGDARASRVARYVTVVVPRMKLWRVQKYAYSPGSVNAHVKVWSNSDNTMSALAIH